MVLGFGGVPSRPAEGVEVALIGAGGAVLREWLTPAFAPVSTYEVDRVLYEAVRTLRIGKADGGVRYEVYLRPRTI